MTEGDEHGSQAPERRGPDRVRRRWLQPRGEVVLLVLLAAAVRLGAWAFRHAILPDSASLLGSAERVADEGWRALLASPHHPLPVLLLSWVPRGEDAEAWGSIGAALLGALAVWPLHIVARYVAGRHAATIAGLAYAVLPKFVAVASVPLTEPVFLPLLAASFAMALTAGLAPSARGRFLRCVLAGGFAGLAYLARPEGLATGFAVVAAAALRCRRGERLRSALIVAAVFAAVAGPCVAELSSDAGRLVLSPKKDLGQFAGFAEAPRDASPETTLANGVRELGGALWGALGPALVLILVGAFAPMRWRRRRAAAGRAILLLTAAGLCALVVRLSTGWDYSGARHALPASLLLLPFAGEGLAVIVGFFGHAVRRRRAALVLTMLVAIPSAVIAMLRPDSESGERERLLGEQLAAVEQARGGGDVFVGSFAQPLVAYYADRLLRPDGRRVRDVRLWWRHRRLLDVSPDFEGGRADLVASLHEGGANWLVLRFWETPRAGVTRGPGEALAERLIEDGVLGTPIIGSSELAAFPVK